MGLFPYQNILLQLIHSGNYDVDFLAKLKKEFASQYQLKDIPSNIHLLKVWREMKAGKFGILPELDKLKKEDEKKLLYLLKKRKIRSQSGIVSVQVLTKPGPCPGSCIFCPNEKGMPKSYISSEPGAMRAVLNKFDPLKQVYNRLHSLSVAGHDTDKIEMIVLGGTFDSYTKEYKIKFIKQLYDACNTFEKLKISDSEKYGFMISNLDTINYSKTLTEAIKKNERANHRIVGLTIETRPEFVTDQNCAFWRELGVTRIEMGVQSLDDEVLKLNQRGHNVSQIRKAFDTMRRWGFKISAHMMPGLYGSDYQKDLKSFEDLYTDPFLKPDEIKFYPTSVIPGTKLAQLYKKGEYKPLETDDIKKFIRQTFLEIIPPYTRIKRLIRDIPAQEILAGSKITNLGQLMHIEIKNAMKRRKISELKKFYERLWPNLTVVNFDYFLLKENDIKNLFSSCLTSQTQVEGLINGEIQTFVFAGMPDTKTLRNFVCLDTRSREIRNKIGDQILDKKEELLVIRKYQSSVGDEYFISYEDKLGYLYGFVRLLLPNESKKIVSHSAMIRELHVYGNVEPIKTKDKNTPHKIQHSGFGKKLMAVAEKLAKYCGFKKIAVISGVGVREYYRKLGYKLQKTYMVKNI